MVQVLNQRICMTRPTRYSMRGERLFVIGVFCTKLADRIIVGALLTFHLVKGWKCSARIRWLARSLPSCQHDNIDSMKLLRIFLTGMFISFLGTLPLGTLNISAMQIAVSDGIRPALLFALGALLVEIIYVRISLVAMNWVTKQKKLLRKLEWGTVIVILALAISSFVAAADPE